MYAKSYMKLICAIKVGNLNACINSICDVIACSISMIP